jgi:hypothetical protein
MTKEMVAKLGSLVVKVHVTHTLQSRDSTNRGANDTVSYDIRLVRYLW